VKGRYRAVTPVSDFNITQKVRIALIDAGHTDLAIEQISEPIRELEESHALLIKRVIALEQEKVKWQTESGVFRAIDKKMKLATGNWAVKILVVIGGLALTAAGAVIDRLIEKPH
jgi:hypothetical protein